jgi:signal transduction histidine kinase
VVGRGLQTEILASLALVMVTASGILAVLLLRTHDAHLLQLRQLAARSLAADAARPIPQDVPAVPGLRWWRVDGAGGVRAQGGHRTVADAQALALAAQAREQGAPLLRAGAPWEPIRFAAPVGSGGAIAVAELPASISRALVLGLLISDVLVFTAFGAYLLRRRVVRPLERLAEAARIFGEGGTGVRAPVEGVRETAELAQAFNEMTEALARRSGALEKAVAELRESNRRLREARAGLDRAERLAAVGRLASGVAHEVGNPMGALLAFLDVAGRDTGLSDQGRQALERAGREGERIRTILRRLLDFSRPARAARVPVDVAAVCEETAALVRAQRRYESVLIEVCRQGDPPRALGDRGALAQIVLNLLLNAADALLAAGSDAPRIRIRVSPGPLERRAGDAGRDGPSRRAGDAVLCCVEDNGPGVPPEDRERIFDPFYTTKAPGEGTGLGLANAARFAEEMGGRLEYAVPEEGQGAAFDLTLAAADAAADSGIREGR